MQPKAKTLVQISSSYLSVTLQNLLNLPIILSFFTGKVRMIIPILEDLLRIKKYREYENKAWCLVNNNWSTEHHLALVAIVIIISSSICISATIAASTTRFQT